MLRCQNLKDFLAVPNTASSQPLPVVLISGPTASGKSSFAIKCAQEGNGEIVNIDSVQCYREAEIGSAKPSSAERSIVPHHLFEEFSPDESIDGVRFTGLVQNVVADIQSRETLPILVGSPGLYVSILYSGIANIPQPSDELRQEIRSISTPKLYAYLQTLDSERAAELQPNDRQRIERAVEICRTTGGSVGAAYTESLPPVVSGLIGVIQMSREKISQAIAIRTAEMFKAGLVEETELILQQYGSKAPVLETIGYRQVRDWLQGGRREAEEELREKVATVTRRYAKRQRTYWRNEPKKRGWRECAAITRNEFLLTVMERSQTVEGVEVYPLIEEE